MPLKCERPRGSHHRRLPISDSYGCVQYVAYLDRTARSQSPIGRLIHELVCVEVNLLIHNVLHEDEGDTLGLELRSQMRTVSDSCAARFENPVVFAGSLL
jgi:hypothetical protein